MNKAVFFAIIFLLTHQAQANCKAANAMKGHWTFQLSGPSILDDIDGYAALTEMNGRQLDLYGNLVFNSQSTLTRGAAYESTDVLFSLLNVVQFDGDEYQGLVVDKKLSYDGMDFNEWTKPAGTCATSVAVGFRGKDKVNGRVYTKVYCALGNYLGKTKHTATLNGYCIRDRLTDGRLKTEFAPVKGLMQKRVNANY